VSIGHHALNLSGDVARDQQAFACLFENVLQARGWYDINVISGIGFGPGDFVAVTITDGCVDPSE
jgi:hypothetical protein